MQRRTSDLQDALSFCKLTHLKAGQTTDAQDADIIIITAGPSKN